MTNAAPDAVAVAHTPAFIGPAPHQLVTRERWEKFWNGDSGSPLAQGATRSYGAGNRAREEAPDTYRLPFERDWHRVEHSKPFRRLAGKAQVYIAPDNDHLRTRLTHALEVAQVAESLANTMGLNATLARAGGLAHDCGHGPAGHASEDALSPFVDGGYDHAVFGADVILSPLNLCTETLDIVRNHSWRRPAPFTPEGEVVAWADRIAYVCHDFEDAVAADIVTPDELPETVRATIGETRNRQLDRFINAMLQTAAEFGVVGMSKPEADALEAFREFNFSHIYLRPAAQEQAQRVIALIRGLAEYYIAHPEQTSADGAAIKPNSDEARDWSVQFVSGMTDRFAMQRAVDHLSWDPDDLPQGVA